MPQPPTQSWSASLLRRDLSARAHHLARTHHLLHDIHPGPSPIVIFGRDEQGRHGNFHPASDTSICANPVWLRRLTKPHTASRRSRARKDWQWMELDSANSSDALLMNIFCHPAVFNGHTLAPSVANLLNVDTTARPCFGINPGVPLKTIRKQRTTRKAQTNLNQDVESKIGKNPGAPDLDFEIWVLEVPPTSPSPIPDQTLTDRTEIDLQLDNLFLEAKLTESNFQTAPPRLIERYRDLETIFDLTVSRKSLSPHPTTREDFSQLEEPHRPTRTHQTTRVIQGYQLIRNVLAAYASDAGFCVLSDARRRDLIEIWYSVLSAVHSYTFATRLKLLTWQELSTALPQDLQQFLDAKYGIVPTVSHSPPSSRSAFRAKGSHFHGYQRCSRGCIVPCCSNSN